MISTGLQKLDTFLSGGIPNGVIIDIFGGNGTGKTQLVLQLSINSIKNGGNVLFLDTTGGFRPERILEIQKKSNLNINLLDKITVSRITNTSEQINLLNTLGESNFSLIVIDNCNTNWVFPVPFPPKISTIIPLGIPPDKKLSNFCKPVEIIYTIYTNIRKNLKNFNFYKRDKAFMLANKFPD